MAACAGKPKAITLDCQYQIKPSCTVLSKQCTPLSDLVDRPFLFCIATLHLGNVLFLKPFSQCSDDFATDMPDPTTSQQALDRPSPLVFWAFPNRVVFHPHSLVAIANR